MGCRRNPKLYKLRFADDDYAGLEITLRSLTIGEMRQVRGSSDDEDDSDVLVRMTRMIAQQMVSWNREDETGQPLPPTYESLEGEEPSLINLIIDQWTQAVSGVPAPLEQPSNSGDPSLVESIPTEALSPSLAS